MMGIRTRKAQPEEAENLSELCIRSKQSNGYDDAFMEACRVELTITRDHFNTTEYWVAEEGRVYGVVGLAVDDDGLSGEVVSFFVDPEMKRRGIGKLLWTVLAELAKVKGLKALYLDADPAAVPFYEALGFRTERMVSSESIPGRLLPQMRLELL